MNQVKVATAQETEMTAVVSHVLGLPGERMSGKAIGGHCLQAGKKALVSAAG
jgi:hypothetical protein